MAKNSARRNPKEMYDCRGHMHGHGKKQILIGLVLLVIGLLLGNGYGWPEILMLIGGILIVKGILIAIFKKDKE